MLGNAFGIPGITVDTHFGRLVRRFGWTAEDDPVKVEHEVGALFPRKDWTMLSHLLIFHGRRICHARKPACGACPVARWCPSYGEGETDPVKAAKLLKYELAPDGVVTVAARAVRRPPDAPGRRGCDGSLDGLGEHPARVLQPVPAAGRGRARPRPC